MIVNFGGIEYFSTVDYPRKISTVLFLNGCHIKCDYCHNKSLWNAYNWINIKKIYEIIDDINSYNFINAIVISGGEPLEQENAIIKISEYIHKKGLKAGLHTSGSYSLKNVYDKFDFILISKPEVDKYENYTN